MLVQLGHGKARRRAGRSLPLAEDEDPRLGPPSWSSAVADGMAGAVFAASANADVPHLPGPAQLPAAARGPAGDPVSRESPRATGSSR